MNLYIYSLQLKGNL